MTLHNVCVFLGVGGFVGGLWLHMLEGPLALRVQLFSRFRALQRSGQPIGSLGFGSCDLAHLSDMVPYSGADGNQGSPCLHPHTRFFID